MPANLYLIRHGETKSNVDLRYQGSGDSLLTENGIEAARELSEHFKDLNFKGIYCSDLTRGLETAKIIAQHHPVSPTVIPKLQERHYGDWEGLNFKEIEKKYPGLYDSWLKNPAKAKIPKAETLEAMQKRGIAALKSILKKHTNNSDNILIVGHGGMNRIILFYFLGLDLNCFWRIRQSNCCVNIIEFGKKRNVVALMNSTGYVNKAMVRKIPIY
ncbi:MAG: histidine phosphatase family protein [Candidatus Margulisbacteria bacterium]|nr:histidine phosphatase family protein [Candidatus Margulisiibacteriota bacterium]MBU1021649.1 histidine phosphatase family protein [Candidatus Margulisiibacteriota bacterium]MBU1728799.1 histidine phosphatase family protein [Candidatus Margulisiibacteriota bacterium]MBU1955765.1 histidine phosphatase family protein [Candidatus Margulisiibacteriota bacterium]